ncbi:unnamed protein product [Phyllotreta striolata]|uniref:NADP-dependent oxidoreductase domain-containing protein n=1 Tax=Phyllotreta striolata TaxID=444603 RepID=A0A9N9XTG2_PHYSR|nr:unnamed protein product [Phyllotreta striolata]
MNLVSFVFSLTTIRGTNVSNTYQPLGNNVFVPSMGFGAHTNDEYQLKTALNRALEVGYRHIDTSPFYKNEHIIGEVIREWISSKKLKRKDLFITTKLDTHPDHIEEALNNSLTNLQLKHVDLYVLQMDATEDINIIHAWKKMEQQVESKRTRSIGLNDFTKEQIQSILKIAKIKPASLHVKVHPYNQQWELRLFCKRRNILVISYNPLGPVGAIDSDPVIINIAKGRRKTTSQVVLRWLHQMHVVVLPATLNSTMIQRNSKIFKFDLSYEDVEAINGLDEAPSARTRNIAKIGDYPDSFKLTHLNG